MKKNFIEYHGCNLLYKDGTRQIVKKHCFKPTLYPFWKLSNDVTNSVGKSRRAQLKNKLKASKEEMLNYQWQKKLISHEPFPVKINLSNKLAGDKLIIDETISTQNLERNIKETKPEPEIVKKETQTTNNKPIPGLNEL